MIAGNIEPLARYYETRIDNSDKARPSPQAAYAKSLRDAVRALWGGRQDRSEFGQAMFSAIERHLEIAWQAGAAECGLRPEDRTPEEQKILEDFMDNQLVFIPAFAEFIEENSKANGGLLRTSLARLPSWVNRWNETKALASQTSCKDKKLMWVLGIAEHCKTCLKLSGRVMRASRWRELDVYPQDTRPGHLDCRGFNCKCRFEETTKRATPGKLPTLP